MCMYVREIPTSVRAGLVWPCRKELVIEGSGVFSTALMYYRLSDDGWLFPVRRSQREDWYDGLHVNGDVIHAYSCTPWHSPGCNNVLCPAWAVGVLAFGDDCANNWSFPPSENMVARALFIPRVAREHGSSASVRKTEAVLRRLAKGDGGRRELLRLHPKLSYALDGRLS